MHDNLVRDTAYRSVRQWLAASLALLVATEALLAGTANAAMVDPSDPFAKLTPLTREELNGLRGGFHWGGATFSFGSRVRAYSGPGEGDKIFDTVLSFGQDSPSNATTTTVNGVQVTNYGPAGQEPDVTPLGAGGGVKLTKGDSLTSPQVVVTFPRVNTSILNTMDFATFRVLTETTLNITNAAGLLAARSSSRILNSSSHRF